MTLEYSTQVLTFWRSGGDDKLNFSLPRISKLNLPR